mgnify:CR=1 FL=1
MGLKRRLDTLLWLASMLGSLFLLNLLGGMAFARLDMTRTGEFTLSPATCHVLESATAPVTVRAYFSQGLPGKLGATARRVHDMLDAYYAAGHGRFSYEFIDPVSLETEEDQQKKKEMKKDVFGNVVRPKTSVESQLESQGIRPATVRVNEADKIEDKRVFLGMRVSSGTRNEVIPLVQSATGFEYELTTRIRKVLAVEQTSIGIVTGFGGPKLDEQLNLFVGELEGLYKVEGVDLSVEQPKIPDAVQALVFKCRGLGNG